MTGMRTTQGSPSLFAPPKSCPECGYPLPHIQITRATVDVELLRFCGSCGVQVLDDGTVGARSEAQWAEHYEGDILRFPRIEVSE